MEVTLDDSLNMSGSAEGSKSQGREGEEYDTRSEAGSSASGRSAHSEHSGGSRSRSNSGSMSHSGSSGSSRSGSPSGSESGEYGFIRHTAEVGGGGGVLQGAYQGLKMSQIDFSIFKALKSLIFGHYLDLRS